MGEVREIFFTLLDTLQNEPTFNFPIYVKTFARLETHVERMDFVYKDFTKCKMFSSYQKNMKNDATSVALRKNGNEWYKAGNYRKALDFYTMSVLEAKTKSILALAYANRSAALYNLDLFEECLKDIDKAFENDYPDKLKDKLIKRQKVASAKKITRGLHYVPIPDFPDSEKNPHIQYARNCVKIMQNEQYGRHIIATKRIEIGQIIAVEPPYSTVVKNEIYVYCHECCTLCYNLIPCNNCNKELYCSDSCKNRAYDSYHKYLCPLSYMLDQVFIDVPKRVALKALFMGAKYWSKNDHVEDHIYRSDRFKELYNLEAHVNNRSKENLLARTTIACALFYLIKNYTTFLQDYNNENKLKEVILHTLLVCSINTVEINELSRCKSLIVYDLNPFATAVYSFFSLFNHSCCPNISRHFHGSSVVLRASHTIKPGEQCFVHYGPHYAMYSKTFRQNFFKENQFFTCNCIACREDWQRKFEDNSTKTWINFQCSTMMKLIDAKVAVAKKELPLLLSVAKQAEQNLPPGDDYYQKDLLSYCYNILGNKRRV